MTGHFRGQINPVKFDCQFVFIPGSIPGLQIVSSTNVLPTSVLLKGTLEGFFGLLQSAHSDYCPRVSARRLARNDTGQVATWWQKLAGPVSSCGEAEGSGGKDKQPRMKPAIATCIRLDKLAGADQRAGTSAAKPARSGAGLGFQPRTPAGGRGDARPVPSHRGQRTGTGSSPGPRRTPRGPAPRRPPGRSAAPEAQAGCRGPGTPLAPTRSPRPGLSRAGSAPPGPRQESRGDYTCAFVPGRFRLSTAVPSAMTIVPESGRLAGVGTRMWGPAAGAGGGARRRGGRGAADVRAGHSGKGAVGGGAGGGRAVRRPPRPKGKVRAEAGRGPELLSRSLSRVTEPASRSGVCPSTVCSLAGQCAPQWPSRKAMCERAPAGA